ncbi:Carbonic anhydrase 7 [Gryllus bimaculatus]|nr:Carbonic anhydrase 7 [Gryllus bimaculatus]
MQWVCAVSAGPSHWSEAYAQCAGKYQSPIDIEEHLLRHVTLPRLRFGGLDAQPVTSTLYNNGHTVMLELNTSKEATVEGGPLNGKYIFKQLHFHWGANSSVGSEATVNNHSFPMELHMVFYKQSYGSMEEAMRYRDGLTVIGLFYELYGPGNTVYNEIVDVLPEVTQPHTNARLHKPITLDSLLPENRMNYFTYNGSLTTPPCLEVVTWIEFKQPILLSEAQVAAFRNLHSPEGLMTHNHRPVQELSGRLVLFNMGEIVEKDNGSAYVTVNYLMFLMSLTIISMYQ